MARISDLRVAGSPLLAGSDPYMKGPEKAILHMFFHVSLTASAANNVAILTHGNGCESGTPIRLLNSIDSWRKAQPEDPLISRLLAQALQIA